MTARSASFVSLNDSETCRQDAGAKSIGYFAARPLVCLTRAVIDQIRSQALASGVNARLSLHTGPDEILHQMVIAQHAALYNRPKMHHTTAKSWHMIEGHMAIVVFDDTGKILDRAVIGDGHGLLYRIGAGVYHTNIPISPLVIHEETLLGPYAGDGDRTYGAFSPDGIDPVAVRNYLASLIGDLRPNA